MVQLTKQEMACIEPFFAGSQETMIWSCLQGCMGEAWVDDAQSPTAVQIITADFSFFAGDSTSPQAAELVCNKGGRHHDYLIMVPSDEAWERLIEQQHGDRQKRLTRYAIKKEGDIFDRQRLATFADALPPGYTLRPIDRELCTLCAEEDWSADLCGWYADYEDFAAHGMGFAVLHGDELVAGVSAYTWYREGIEIEIDTKKEYRRQGLATACASKLILTCLEKGLYPSWDAHNLGSVGLAEKLGYHFDKEYTAYLVSY